MDFCRNMSVSGGLPSEYQQEQVLSPPCSKLGGGLTGSLDDLFSGQNTEVDVSLEWLSIFVEDCFSSTGHCLPAAAAATNIEKKTSTSTPKHLQLQKPQEKHKYPTSTTTTPSLQKFVFPSKARSKRRRPTTTTTTTTVNNNRAKSSWVHQLNPQSHHHSSDLQLTSSDPPLLQQAYWLADSELILPPKKEDNCNLLLLPVPVPVPVPVGDDETKVEIHQVVNKVEEEKEMVMGSSLEGGGVVGQARRCTHCLSQRTPQWRAGPLGPKTLCNACGVRYKSGRLLPEYRPAKSPTFVSYLHSNSHKKVLEMRMGALSPTSPHH